MKYIKGYHQFVNEIFGFNKKSVLKDIKIGDKGENVKNLQKNLEALGFKLERFGVDSIIGKETYGNCLMLSKMIKKIPSLKNKYPDFVITDNVITGEQQEMIQQMVSDGNVKDEVEKYYNELTKTIGNQPIVFKDLIMKKIDEPIEFIKKVFIIADKLDMNPNWILAIMYKECGFDAHAVNSDTNATGLIQFIPSTAKGLGTSVEEIKKMDAITQLDYVYKYFLPYVKYINTYGDAYCAVFYPKALGKDDDYELGGHDVASVNKGVDLNQDDVITVGEFKRYAYKGFKPEVIKLLNNNE